MKQRRQPKGRYNFLIDQSVYEEFSRVCEEQGMIRSKILENSMKEFLKKNKEKKDAEHP